MGDIGHLRLSTGTGGGAQCPKCKSFKHYRNEYLHIFLIADTLALIRAEVHCSKCRHVWYTDGWEVDIPQVDDTEIPTT